jgi:WbqC-like protein family
MHQSPVLLSTTYFGPVQYYTKFILYDEIWLEANENYTRQTYRNRCIIYGANGELPLTIPVITSEKHKIIIKDIRIDYSRNWQKLHWKGIESAYMSSPFYEFFIDDFQPFFSKRFKFLFDLNMEILTRVLHLLELNPKIKLTDSFLFPGTTEIADMRDSIHPKKTFQSDKLFEPMEYKQVFSEKHGFLANLSIIDVIFNAGPDIVRILRGSGRPLEVFKTLGGF